MKDLKKLMELVEQRRIFKRQEDAAAESRKAIDAQICDLLPQSGGKKTTTEKFVDANSGMKISVSVTRNETVKVDTESLQRDWAKVSPEAAEAFRWKAEVDAKKFVALGEAAARVAARYITTAPAAPGIKITVE